MTKHERIVQAGYLVDEIYYLLESMPEAAGTCALLDMLSDELEEVYESLNA